MTHDAQRTTLDEGRWAHASHLTSHNSHLINHIS